MKALPIAATASVLAAQRDSVAVSITTNHSTRTMHRRVAGSMTATRAATASVLLALIVGGCATHPDQIDAQHVPPEKYSELDCSQLVLKRTAIKAQITTLRNRLEFLNETASGSLAPVAWYVLWPELIYHGVAEAPKMKAEYSRLLGEYEAIRHTESSKGCAVSTPASGEAASPPASAASSAD